MFSLGPLETRQILCEYDVRKKYLYECWALSKSNAPPLVFLFGFTPYEMATATFHIYVYGLMTGFVSDVDISMTITWLLYFHQLLWVSFLIFLGDSFFLALYFLLILRPYCSLFVYSLYSCCSTYQQHLTPSVTVHTHRHGHHGQCTLLVRILPDYRSVIPHTILSPASPKAQC